MQEPLTSIPGQEATATPVTTSFVKRAGDGAGVKAQQGSAGDVEHAAVAGKKRNNYPTRRPNSKQLKAAKLYSENLGKDKPAPDGEVLRQAGYSQETSETPARIIETDSFQALLTEVMPDNLLTETHHRLLKTRKLEHMVFPLEHQDPDDLARPYPIVEELREQEIAERRIIDNLSDEDVIDMLAEVACQVKRIVHGETARHVYYWAHDAKAQASALELAYRLKGHLNKEGAGGNTFNFNSGTQNFIKKAEVKPS